jgi:hypothetical protein
MFLRPAPVVLVATLAFGLVGCSGIAATPVASAPSTGPATAVESAKPSSTRPTPIPTAMPDSGNVDAPVTPALSVEPVGAVAIRITLADPAAKAWRVTVADAGSSLGSAGASSWSLTIDTGDVAPVITTTDTLNDVAGEPQEQPGLEAGTTTGRVCSVAVPVCIRAASVVLPRDGNGTLVLEIGKTDTAATLAVTGATAGWPTDPFALGPWTTTAAFPWGA